MLHRSATLALAAPRRVVALVALVMAAAAIFGIPAANSLSSGGFEDPDSESARAGVVLRDTFGRSDMQLILTVTGGADSTATRDASLTVTRLLDNSSHVLSVVSPRTGVIVAEIDGDDTDAPEHAQQLADSIDRALDPLPPDVTVRAGGSAMVYAQINDQTQRDLVVMELVALPVSFVVLVWVFGGLLAATVPIAVGALCVVASMSVLRLLAMVTDVSVLALNLCTAFVASRGVGAFEGSIEKLAALAALMPIVAGIGGNSGNQTTTLIVRAMALGQVTRENARRLLVKELGISVLNGVLWGGVLGLIAYALYRNVALGGVMALAMLLNLVVAALAGLFVPLAMERFGRDPAVGSSVFLTFITDSMGFFIFLGLATIVLL